MMPSAGRTTYFAYDAMGNMVLTATAKTWNKSDGSAVSGWVASKTLYDASGWAVDTYQATYTDSHSETDPDILAHITVTTATGTSLGDVSVDENVYDDATQSIGGTELLTGHTEYNNSGQVSTSTGRQQRDGSRFSEGAKESGVLDIGCIPVNPFSCP
jgi:hypothetical protein